MRRAITVAAVAIVAVAAWWIAPRWDGSAGVETRGRAASEERPGPPPAAAPASTTDALAATAERSPDAPRATQPRAIESPRWVVRGFVHSGVQPVSGAEVELTLRRGALAQPIARLMSSADGRFEWEATAAIAALSEVARSLATVGGVARAAGFHARSAEVDLEQDARSLLELDFDLTRGAAVRGRVVDGALQPVAGAAVVALLGAERHRSPRERSGRDGRFELPIVEASDARIHAAAFGIGSALTEVLSLSPHADTEVADLILMAAGEVGGRAIDPLGAPVRGLVVDALASGASAREFEEPSNTEGRGLTHGRTRSGSDGEFRIRGLAPGEYRLFAYAGEVEERGGERTHALGDTSAVLVVVRHRLRIRVRDEHGNPLPGAQLMCRSAVNARSMAVDDDGVGELIGKTSEEWTIGASAPHCVPAEASFRFEAGRYDDEVELVLRRHGSERGALRLELTTAAGVPLDGATVDVLTLGGSLVEHGFKRELGSDFLLDDLVPGRFRLRVRPGRSLVSGFHDLTWFFPFEVEADVVAGEERPVVAAAPSGGRLRFTVRVPAGAGLDGLRDAKLALVGEVEQPPSLRVVFRTRDDGTSEYGGLDLEPDAAYASARLLEPGVHTLRLSARGFADLERTFTIHPGGFTDVELSLAAE